MFGSFGAHIADIGSECEFGTQCASYASIRVFRFGKVYNNLLNGCFKVNFAAHFAYNLFDWRTVAEYIRQ